MSKKSPSEFLKSVLGRPVIVKLNSGTTYHGILACLDGYMNIAMEQTQEFVNGQLKNTYADTFIRGNNALNIVDDSNTIYSRQRSSTPIVSRSKYRVAVRYFQSSISTMTAQHIARNNIDLNNNTAHTLLATLEHAEGETIERCLKQIKNFIIGNVAHKNLFLTQNILHKLAALLSRDALARDWRVLEAAVVVLGSIVRTRTDWSAHAAELFRLSDHVQQVLARVHSAEVDLPKKETLLLSCCRTLSQLLQLDLSRDRPALHGQTLQLLTELLLFRTTQEHVTRRDSQLLITVTALLSRVMTAQHVTDLALAPEHVIYCLEQLARDTITWTTRESLLHFLSLSVVLKDSIRAWHVAFERVRVIPILSRTLTTVAVHSANHTAHYQIRLDLCHLTAHIAGLNVAGLSKNRDWCYFWTQIAHQIHALFSELPATINSSEDTAKYLQQLSDVTTVLCTRLPNLEALLLENSLLVKVAESIEWCLAECVQHVISVDGVIQSLLKLIDHVLSKAYASKSGNDPKWSSTFTTKHVMHASVYSAVTAVLNMASDSTAPQISNEIPLHCLLQLTRLGIRHVFAPHKTLLAQRTNQSEDQSRDQSPAQLVTQLIDLAAKKGEDDHELVTRAISCVCNLVLEIRALSHVLLAHDATLLRQLIAVARLSAPRTPQLCLAGLWTLKNLVHESSLSVKQQVMQHVTWPVLCALLNDTDTGVQQHALALTRNLVHKVTAEQFQGIFPTAEFSEQLMQLLKKAKSPSVVSQTLYVLANIAECHPQLLFEHNLVLPIMEMIDINRPAEVLMASLWCLVNLTWSAEDDTLTRVKQLADTARIGFLERLRLIRGSDALAVDVQDRAKQVLDQMVLRD